MYNIIINFLSISARSLWHNLNLPSPPNSTHYTLGSTTARCLKRTPPPVNMLGQDAATCQQVNNFVAEKVNVRRAQIQQSIHQVVKLVQEVMKDVEQQEPRFIPTLLESGGRYEGVG